MTRALVFILTGFLLITLLGPIQHIVGLEFVTIDVPLITVVYLALAGRLGLMRLTHRPSLSSGGLDWPAGLTSFALGYLNDLLSGGIKGFHCLSMVLLYFFCLWAARHVYLTGSLSIIVVTFMASLVAALVGIVARWFTGVPPSLATLAVVASQAILCAAVAPLLMRLFRFIDNKLSPDNNERGTLCP